MSSNAVRKVEDVSEPKTAIYRAIAFRRGDLRATIRALIVANS
jgi:hypothetical protein